MSESQPTLQSSSVLQYQEALREHFERAPLGILLLAEDRTVLHANDAIVELTGLSLSHLAGSPLQRLLTSDAPLDLEDSLFSEVREAGFWLGELDVRTSIGVASPMMISITPVGASESSIVRYVVTIVELGQQQWIEAESTRRAAEIAAFSALAVATGSSSEPQQMLNAAAREIVERLEMDACWIHRFEAAESRISLVGEASHLNPSLDLSPHMIPDMANPAVLQAIQTHDQVVDSELLDRSIATVVHIPLLAGNDVVGVVSILSVEGEKLSSRNSDLLRAIGYQIGTAIQNIRLVESVRKHQAELERNNEQLEQLVEELKVADRMKSEFLANTSHELRTPLNSIIGFLNLVVDGLCESRDEEKELLSYASRSARHLLDLINDVLDLSRIEAGRIEIEFKEINLASVMNDVCSTLAVQANNRDLALEVGPIAADLTVRADEARLRQILMNVVGNAIKFTPRGEVEIAVDAPPGSPFAEICVRDTGIGIAPEKLDRLFKKFSQADASTTRRYGGSGLGLVIVKQLIEMMGGTVRLESPGEGEGSTIWITVPSAPRRDVVEHRLGDSARRDSEAVDRTAP